MERPKIGPGYCVGKLEVLRPTVERKNGYTVWHCKCDCGGEALLDTRCLQRGAVRDCGCTSRVPPGARDLSGQRFGKLTAEEPTEARDDRGRIVWRCRCDCGGEALVSAGQLLGGYVKSCGCLSHPPRKDYVGRRFGMLTVVAYAGKRAGMHRWRCRCDCGKETEVGQTLLQTGRTKSCGCLQAEIVRKNMKLVEGTSVAILEANRKHLRRNNTSGYTGVYRDKRTGKWVARITFQRHVYHLGCYEELSDAVKARRRGEEMHENFLDWYYSTQAKSTTTESA